MSRFDGQWFVVTGASSGLGQAVAGELARQGANVVLMGRRRAALEQLAGALAPDASRIVEIDLTRHDEIVPAVLAVRRDVGVLHGMCHAAGIVETRPLPSNTIDVVRAQMDINLLAGLELARAVCRRDVMTAQGGSLLFISSVYGKVACQARRATAPPRAPSWRPRVRSRWSWPAAACG